MRYTSTKERITIMQALTDKNVRQVLEYSRGAVSDMDRNARMRVRFDLRTWIKSRMKEEGVTVYGMAKVLGVSQANLAAFLNGRIPCPLDRVEELLWLLLPEEHMTDD